MLQEAKLQFDIIDSQSDFSKYRVLVLPDEIPVSDELSAKLSQYLAAGGAIVASYKSGLAPQGDRFNLPELGVSYRGEAEFSPDFLVPGKLKEGLADTGHVMYMKGIAVEPAAGAEVLSPVIRPYFNRTWEHFCSHRHTPAQGPADYPGIVRRGNCIYFMHPVFTQYDRNAPLWCKSLVVNALKLLLPEPLVTTNAPSTALMTLNAQPEQNRLVLHALNYVPERRGRDFDVIEEVLPIYSLKTSVRVEGRVQAVKLVPQGVPLEFEEAGDRVEFVIPRVDGHQMVEIALAE
jgi:hypothetical protein